MRRLALSTLGLAFLLIALAPSDASAQKGKKARRAQDRELIRELRTIKTAIVSARHNYKGHRAKAIGQVKHAIGQLARDTGKKGGKGKKGAVPPVKSELTQAESDAVLSKAKTDLGSVLQQLNALPVTAHRTKAAGHLQHAIKQLDKALAVVR